MNKRKAHRKQLKKQKKKEKVRLSYQDKYRNMIGSPTLANWVFPIYTCYKDGDNIQTTNISGTAFYIENGLFLTASHVLDYDPKYNNHIQIGYLNQTQKGCVAMYDFEIKERFVENDIAIIECQAITAPDNKPKAFHWHHRNLKYYDIIRAMGYPSGYDSKKKIYNSKSISRFKSWFNTISTYPNRY